MADDRWPMADGRWPMADDRGGNGVELEAFIGMSKHNNVNPGQYKVGGRLHPGDDSSRQEHDKAEASKNEQRLREEARGPQKEKE